MDVGFVHRHVNSRSTIGAEDRDIRPDSRLGWPQQARDGAEPQTDRPHQRLYILGFREDGSHVCRLNQERCCRLQALWLAGNLSSCEWVHSATMPYASPLARDCFLFHPRRTESNQCDCLKSFDERFESPARPESNLPAFEFSNGRFSRSQRRSSIGRESTGMPYSRSFLRVCWFTCSTELKRRHGVNLGEVGVMLRRHIQTVRGCESNELLGRTTNCQRGSCGRPTGGVDFGH